MLQVEIGGFINLDFYARVYAVNRNWWVYKFVCKELFIDCKCLCCKLNLVFINLDWFAKGLCCKMKLAGVKFGLVVFI